jgi:uncharacterized integral membrane protein
MLWKVIVSLVILVVALVFVGFNVNNQTKISVGFHEWTDVPVFLAMFFSFAFGALFMVPFLIRARFHGKRARKQRKEKEAAPSQEPLPPPPASP